MNKLFFSFFIILMSCELQLTDTKSFSAENSYAKSTLVPMTIIQDGCIDLVEIETNNTYLKKPHDAIRDSQDSSIFYISGKGHPSGVTTDGSFGIASIDSTGQISILGGYSGNGDQKDGETVLQLSPTRVVHFVRGNAVLLNINRSNWAVTKVKTVSYTTGVINGAVELNGYVFGANKGGHINVFTSDPNNFVHVMNKKTYSGTGTDPNLKQGHDIDKIDSEHIVVGFQQDTQKKVAIYKVFDNGVLLPANDWVLVSTLNDTILFKTNRIRVWNNYVIAHSGLNVTKIDISDKENPVIVSTIYNGIFSSGSQFFKNYLVAVIDVGIKVIDLETFTEECYYYNNDDFSDNGNGNFHDMGVMGNYLLVTVQNANQVATFHLF